MIKGKCNVCNRINVLIYVMHSFDGRIYIRCYGRIRGIHGVKRKRKLMKIKKDNEIKLTMWY